MQTNFFKGTSDNNEAAANLLEGFRYRPVLIGSEEEGALVSRIRELPFREFEFHGFLGKRRVVSFGWQYDYSGRGLRKADDIPKFLVELRALAASFANLNAETFQQVLVTEYGPGAGIGWHRDKAVFGEVVGVSLLAPCVLRFRRKSNRNLSNEPGRLKPQRNAKGNSQTVKSNGKLERFDRRAKWDRVNVNVEPRSAYHLSGPSRFEWYHSILRVDELRYAITFRNVNADDSWNSK
jgi:alkylated DNA repair dioxygenase AlkB